MDRFVISLLLEAVIVRLDRTIQYAAASRFLTAVSGILDRPPSRAMTAVGVARVSRPSLRAQAKQSMGPRSKSGLLRRFAPRNDVAPSRSRGAISPEFCKLFRRSEKRGRRECRALNAPAASHAK